MLLVTQLHFNEKWNNMHGEYRQKNNFVLLKTNLVLIQIT